MRTQHQLRFFQDDEKRAEHLHSLKKLVASQCNNNKCIREGECSCGCHCILDDGTDPKVILDKARWALYGFDYADFPDGPQIPVIGQSQIITTQDANNVLVSNYTGVLPVVPTGGIQVIFPFGLRLGSTTPNGAIVVLSGIQDNNSNNLNLGAHLLNTLWIVRASGTPNVWRLRKLRLTGYAPGDIIQIQNFMSATQTTPTPWVVEVTDVNCPENTFVFTITEYTELPQYIVLHTIGLACPRKCAENRCGSSCNGSRCGQHNVCFSIVHPDAYNSHVNRNTPDRRPSAQFNGAGGLRQDKATGRPVAGRIDDILDLTKHWDGDEAIHMADPPAKYDKDAALKFNMAMERRRRKTALAIALGGPVAAAAPAPQQQQQEAISAATVVQQAPLPVVIPAASSMKSVAAELNAMGKKPAQVPKGAAKLLARKAALAQQKLALQATATANGSILDGNLLSAGVAKPTARDVATSSTAKY